MSPGPVGPVVLVTGASRGIGAATARSLAARGARVSLVGLEPDGLARVAAETGGAWFEADVTDQAALDAAVAGTVERFGGLDVVVANAGVAHTGTVASAPPSAVARTLEVDLVGAVRTVTATLPAVAERRGYYLLVSSAAAFAPVPGLAAYGAAKAGLEHFGRALRLELAHRGVDVGVAHMTWVDTDLVRDQLADSPRFAASLAWTPGPLGRVVPVEECAEAFARAVERRSRVVHVPRSVAMLGALRGVLRSPVVSRLAVAAARRSVPRLEAETAAVGRAFGARSAGLGPRARPS